MDKTFSPADIEIRWYQQWESKDISPRRAANALSAFLYLRPMSRGSLHMGHGFQQAIMDALIRYHRMLGHNTLWQVGTDHGGHRHSNAGGASAGKRGC